MARRGKRLHVYPILLFGFFFFFLSLQNRLQNCLSSPAPSQLNHYKRLKMSLCSASTCCCCCCCCEFFGRTTSHGQSPTVPHTYTPCSAFSTRDAVLHEGCCFNTTIIVIFGDVLADCVSLHIQCIVLLLCSAFFLFCRCSLALIELPGFFAAR